MTPIALRLKELREARGWSQVELAARAKVTQATISRLENGRPKSLDVGVLEKVALAFGVNAALLIAHEPPAQRERKPPKRGK